MLELAAHLGWAPRDMDPMAVSELVDWHQRCRRRNEEIEPWLTI